MLLPDKDEMRQCTGSATAPLGLTTHDDNRRERRRGEGERGERRSVTADRFISRAKDDTTTGGGQVGNVTRQAGPVSASAPLIGGPR
jgi:hypothetical protein